MFRVIRDPGIKHPDIPIPIQTSDKEELGQEGMDNRHTIKQSDVYGVLCPLLALNGMAVPFDDFIYLELDSMGPVPKVSFEFNDRFLLFVNNNEIKVSDTFQVQILPPFDNTYKKINLEFYITEFNISGKVVSGAGIYKNPVLKRDQFRCLGELTTWELCDKASQESRAGFATNVDATEDKRLISLSHESYTDKIEDEMNLSVADGSQVYSWWVDWWDNIILCNIAARAQHKDPDEDMMVWISDNTNSYHFTADPPQPIKVKALLTNHYHVTATELQVKDFEMIDRPGVYVSGGSQRIISTYMEDTKEYRDHKLIDSEVESDDHLTFEYAGEVYGSYDYLLADQTRSLYMDKLCATQVEITTGMPLLGVMRGDQVDFAWYENSYERDNINTAAGGPREEENPNADNLLQQNKQVSGRYLINGLRYIFENGVWSCKYKGIKIYERDI